MVPLILLPVYNVSLPYLSINTHGRVEWLLAGLEDGNLPSD